VCGFQFSEVLQQILQFWAGCLGSGIFPGEFEIQIPTPQSLGWLRFPLSLSKWDKSRLLAVTQMFKQTYLYLK
jgi:hypothetical protein